MFVYLVPLQSLKGKKNKGKKKRKEEQVVAVRREWVDQSLQLFKRRKGHWARFKKCPWGLMSAGIPTSPHADSREVPGRFNHTVTQMSQHDYRERIIVEACRLIFNRRAQDKEA